MLYTLDVRGISDSKKHDLLYADIRSLPGVRGLEIDKSNERLQIDAEPGMRREILDLISDHGLRTGPVDYSRDRRFSTIGAFPLCA